MGEYLFAYLYFKFNIWCRKNISTLGIAMYKPTIHTYLESPSQETDDKMGSCFEKDLRSAGLDHEKENIKNISLYLNKIIRIISIKRKKEIESSKI